MTDEKTTEAPSTEVVVVADKPNPPPPESVETRLHNLELAFHSFLSHESAAHPAVVNWAQGITKRFERLWQGGGSNSGSAAPPAPAEPAPTKED